jgi:putative aminopeptidase FrvX
MKGSNVLERVELLKRLCSTPALSGFEEPMIRIMRAEMSRYCNDVQIDRLGNVIARVPASQPGGPTLMLMAHMDELGFVIRKIEPDGFLRVHRLGGVPERVLAGQAIAIRTDDERTLPGVVGFKSHHFTPAEEKYVVLPVENIYIDAGFRDAASVEAAGIHVGTPATYWPFFQQAGNLVMSKTLDDRLGCVALLEILETFSKESPGIQLACVATTQEEFSGRASESAAALVKPDVSIALDVGIACDTPDLRGSADIALDRGPIINTYTFHPRGPLVGTLPNPKLLARMQSTARQREIPYQLGTFFGGLTDASYVQYTGSGVPVIEIGIPVRYTHSPIEVASLDDLRRTIELLTAFIREISSDLDLARG